jgi:hypothetical protein
MAIFGDGDLSMHQPVRIPLDTITIDEPPLYVVIDYNVQLPESPTDCYGNDLTMLVSQRSLDRELRKQANARRYKRMMKRRGAKT